MFVLSAIPLGFVDYCFCWFLGVIGSIHSLRQVRKVSPLFRGAVRGRPKEDGEGRGARRRRRRRGADGAATRRSRTLFAAAATQKGRPRALFDFVFFSLSLKRKTR